jgi:hypothetical protein
MEEYIMAFNKNEVLLDRVRSLTCHDLETKKMLLRLTSLEDPSLNTTAEGEEVVDAIGAPITTMYRAKKGAFSASNSLMSLDLAAAQYGAKKEVVGENGVEKIVDYAYEILKIETETTGEGDDAVTTVKPIKLTHAPIKNSTKWIYKIENNEVGEAIAVGAAAADATTDDEGKPVPATAIIADDGSITLPPSMKSGKIYVEYTYETDKAVRVVNKASEFPSAVSVVIYAYFRDVCNENKIYSGKIICPKAKLNPESVELALTSTGKHPFEFVINRDYCAEEGQDELFEIILSE